MVCSRLTGALGVCRHLSAGGGDLRLFSYAHALTEALLSISITVGVGLLLAPPTTESAGYNGVRDPRQGSFFYNMLRQERHLRRRHISAQRVKTASDASNVRAAQQC